MNELLIKYNDKNEGIGSVRVYVKKNTKIYINDFNLKHVSSYKSCAERYARYISWCDKHDLRLSGFWQLGSLKRSRIRSIRYSFYPSFFDHTYFFRMQGDRFPCFCLTQPYAGSYECKDYLEENDRKIELLRDEGFDFKIQKPSKYSIHYPNKTYMIFMWHRDYFKFDDKYLTW